MLYEVITGGKLLILQKGMPPGPYPALLWKNKAIQAHAFPDPGGKEKIAQGNDPRDPDKNPGAEEAGGTRQQGIAIPFHFRYSQEKKRWKNKREKVAEFRLKSTQGRKWLIRSPLG